MAKTSKTNSATRSPRRDGEPSASAQRAERKAWINRLTAATGDAVRTVGALFREVGAPLDRSLLRALSLKVAILARNPGDLDLDEAAEVHVVSRAGAAAALGGDDVLIGLLDRLARSRKARAHTVAELVQAVPTHQKAAMRAALASRAKQRRWPPGVGAIASTRATLVFRLADVAGIAAAPAPVEPVPARPPFDEAFDRAFERIQGPRGLNLVSLAALRQALSSWDRDGFDRELGALRAADRVVLHTFDGRHGKLDADELAAAITEGGRRFVYAARREP